jgi:DNA-binding NarL/FixJ family response regulator
MLSAALTAPERAKTPAPTRVAVVEADPAQREYLRALVVDAGFPPADEHAELPATLRPWLRARPTLVIIDLDALPRFDREWLATLHRQLPGVAVLILSSRTDRDLMFQVLEAGVSGWLRKPCAPQQLLKAMAVLQQGGAVLCNHTARHVLDYFQARGRSVDCLTAREREALSCLGQGLAPAASAEKMGISGETFRTHMRNVLSKLNAKSRAEAVARYLDPLAPPIQST